MKFTLLALGLALAASSAAYGQDAANAPLAPQTTPQTATPHQQVEQSIRDFAASVTQPQQFGFTTSFVPGANPKGASERSWKAHWEESLGNATFSIKDVKTTFAGADKAASRVRYTLQTPLFASAPYEETLFLLRVAAPDAQSQWVFAAPDNEPLRQNGAVAEVLPLGYALWALGHPDAAAAKVRGQDAQARLKMLGAAFLQLSQEQDLTKISSPQELQKQLAPLLPNAGAGLVPGTTVPWAFNANLTGLNPFATNDPKWSKVVAFYYGLNEQLRFAFDGKAPVIFVSGQTAMVAPEDAKELIWKP